MSRNGLYVALRNNSPKLKVVKDPKEVIIHIVSCMCDNKHTLRLKKNDQGEFKLNGMGFALSNYQMKHRPYEIEWEADKGGWDEVFRMINTGTSVIEKVVSR